MALNIPVIVLAGAIRRGQLIRAFHLIDTMRRTGYCPAARCSRLLTKARVALGGPLSCGQIVVVMFPDTPPVGSLTNKMLNLDGSRKG